MVYQSQTFKITKTNHLGTGWRARRRAHRQTQVLAVSGQFYGRLDVFPYCSCILIQGCIFYIFRYPPWVWKNYDDLGKNMLSIDVNFSWDKEAV